MFDFWGVIFLGLSTNRCLFVGGSGMLISAGWGIWVPFFAEVTPLILEGTAQALGVK